MSKYKEYADKSYKKMEQILCFNEPYYLCRKLINEFIIEVYNYKSYYHYYKFYVTLEENEELLLKVLREKDFNDMHHRIKYLLGILKNKIMYR